MAEAGLGPECLLSNSTAQQVDALMTAFLTSSKNNGDA